MKKSLFLYLFIMAVLMNVFTYAYFSKKSSADEQLAIKRTATMRDSITALSSQLDDALYFTLQRNDNAKEYFADYNTDELIPKIIGQIMDYNDRPEGNILVPYDKMNDQKFIINKAEVLNHRWIIADFSDGTFWGEVLLKYFVEEDGSFTFERIDSQLYQKQQIEE